MGRPLHGHENKSILDAILSAPFVGTTLAALNTWLGTSIDESTEPRNPNAHAASHVGADAIQDATTLQKGLMTSSQASKLDGIESGADVTDATNVSAAGAVMATTLGAKGSLVSATGAATPANLGVGGDNEILVSNSVAAIGLVWRSFGAILDLVFSAGNEGTLAKTGASTYNVRKDNLGAVVDPTVDDDAGDGYTVGSRWVNNSTPEEFVCLDATGGAADWQSTTTSGGGALSFIEILDGLETVGSNTRALGHWGPYQVIYARPRCAANSNADASFGGQGSSGTVASSSDRTHGWMHTRSTGAVINTSTYWEHTQVDIAGIKALRFVVDNLSSTSDGRFWFAAINNAPNQLTTTTVNNHTVGWRYDTANGDANLYAVSKGAGSAEETDTGITLATGTRYVLDIVQDGSDLLFYVDRVLVATHTTKPETNNILSCMVGLRNLVAANKSFDWSLTAVILGDSA